MSDKWQRFKQGFMENFLAFLSIFAQEDEFIRDRRRVYRPTHPIQSADQAKTDTDSEKEGH